jgi:hemoglobin
MVSYLTYLTGGAPTYNGRSIRGAHAGRGIENKHFDKVFEIVVATLKELKVPDDIIAELGSALGSLRKEVAE